MDMQLDPSQVNDDKHVIGNFTSVRFPSVNKSLSGKVDTGATTSSLHAKNIQVSQESNKVSFVCPDLSDSVLTMDLVGAQEVVSADAGGNTRPVVKFDVEIDRTPIKGVDFNLNDREEMDSPILVGQNILKAGNFIIDVSKDSEPTAETDQSDEVTSELTQDRDNNIAEAMKILVSNNVTIFEIAEYYVRYGKE